MKLKEEKLRAQQKEQEEQPARRPKKGDYVVVIAEHSDKSTRRRDTTGMVGVVVEDETGESELPFQLRFGKQHAWHAWYRADWVRLASAEEQEAAK